MRKKQTQTHDGEVNSEEAGRTLLLCRQLPQHVLQDAAVLVVLDLLRRVDADSRLEGYFFAFGGSGYHRDRPAVLEPCVEPLTEVKDVVSLLAGKAERLYILGGLKLQRQN